MRVTNFNPNKVTKFSQVFNTKDKIKMELEMMNSSIINASENHIIYIDSSYSKMTILFFEEERVVIFY